MGAGGTLTVTTAWVPVEVAVEYRVGPRLARYGSVVGAGGLALVGPLGLVVSGGGAALGVQGRWGARPRR